MLGRNSGEYDSDSYQDILILLHNFGVRSENRLYTLLYNHKDDLENYIQKFSENHHDYHWIEKEGVRKFEVGKIKAKKISNIGLTRETLLLEFGPEAMYR